LSGPAGSRSGKLQSKRRLSSARGEKELIDDAKSALSKVDKLLKKDLRKTDTLSQEVADVRQHMANLLTKLDSSTWLKTWRG